MQEKNNLDVKAIILSYDDYEQKPEEFTTSPTYSIKNCLKKAKMNIDDVDFFEINEAFAVVALANQKLLNISIDKLNLNGGAVSLGHPLGMSGCRIIVSLLSVLEQNNKIVGCASICNGGGGASAVLIKRVIKSKI